MAGLGAASYKLALDAGDVKAGAATAQASFRSVQATFRSLESPLEKLERKLASAEKAQNDFIQGTETWNRAASNIAKLRQEIAKLNATPIDSGKMRADMANVGKEVAGRIPVIGRYTSMLGNIHPAAIAAAAGIAAVGGALMTAKRAGEFVFDKVVEQLNAVDVASKAARQTGFDFTTFAALGRVGELADIQNIGGALKQFTQLVGLASLGNEKAAKTFKMLGIDAQALAQMDARERLKFVADRLAGVESQAQRTAIAVKLFGDDGAKMIEVLASGGSAIDAAVADIERFRLGLTDAQGMMVETANDAVRDVGLSIQGIFRQIAVEVAPQVKVISDMLTTALQGEYGAEAITAVKTGLDLIVGSVALWVSLQDKVVASLLTTEAIQKRLTGQFAAASALEQEAMKRALSSPYTILSEFYAEAEKARAEAAANATAAAAKNRNTGLGGAVNVADEKEDEKSEALAKREADREDRAVDHANKAAEDKIRAMEIEREMWGRSTREITREREAREMERAGVNQYLIDLFRERSAELETLETKRRAAEEAAKEAKENARKQAAEDKRIADEQKRTREQMFKTARQAVTATSPEAQYRESIRQFTEWLQAKAITMDEFARLKEEAAKKLAKPIRIGRVDTGVAGIQKGSAEAVELAWRLRAQRKELATPPKAEQTQAEIDRSIATKQAAMEHFGAMIAADKARKDAEAAAIAEADKTVAERDKGLAAQGIDQAGIAALNESSWEGASTAPEIAIAREQQRKAQEEAQRQAAAQAAEQARRAAEQASVQRQYAEGFSDLSQRDMEGRGPLAVQPTDAIGNVLRDTITQQNAQQSEEAKDGPKTVGTLGEIRDILRNGQASQITVQEVSAI
jgi:hypothetical protein